MYTKSIILGPVELQTSNAKELLGFYVDIVGLKILSQQKNVTVLGDGPYEILRITEKAGLSVFNENGVGLYHNAILFPTRSRLAKAIKRIYLVHPYLVEGTSDHLVSEAFYFHDPDGNGLELYFDKPKEIWPMTNGKPQMGSIYIDPQQFLDLNLDLPDNEEPLKLGHIHLQINDIAMAKEFYSNILGTDIIFDLPTALFVSYDGYHHHFGLNTWNVHSKELLNSNSTGLRSFKLTLKNESLFKNIIQNMKKAKIHFTENNKLITVLDPFGIEIELSPQFLE
jgi:catechol 2,3-dioxygenase